MEPVRQPKISKDAKPAASLGSGHINEARLVRPLSADADSTRALHSPVQPIRRLPDGSIDQSHYAEKARLHRAEAWTRAVKSIWSLIGARRRTGD